MANKYYIGGVANVRAYDENSQLVFNAKTLTDSSIQISVSKEEVRGGEGAQLLGNFFHTTNFNLSMTDALFNLGYIQQQVGGKISAGTGVGTAIFKAYKAVSESSTIKVDLGGDTIYDLDDSESNDLICWNPKGEKLKISTQGVITLFDSGTPGAATALPVANDCITVPIKSEKTGNTNEQVQVSAFYQPNELHLFMEAKLYAGDACNVSGGKKVGYVVIEVPRFLLDGNVDLGMAMTSPATFALNGSALANGCGCGNEAWYAKITTVFEA